MSNEYVIIGIDPGLMTGVFWYSHPLTPIGVRAEIDAAGIPVYVDNMLKGMTRDYGARNVHIAVERYIITPKTAKLSQQTEALEVTGMVKAIAAIHGVTDVQQYAKANLKFASDDMLKAVAWKTPGMRHAMDAARQAFALLKDVDYPRWSELVRDASMEPTTEG